MVTMRNTFQSRNLDERDCMRYLFSILEDNIKVTRKEVAARMTHKRV